MELWITINPDETPFSKTLQQIKNLLIDDYPYQSEDLSFVLCREVATREHYHLYFKDSIEPYSDKARNKIRRYLRNIFPGELRFSKRQVESTINTIAYAIKDGNYITHKIDWLTFLEARRISHPKKKEYKDAIQEFYQNVSGKKEEKLISEVIDIFDNYNIPIDTQRIAKIVRLSRIKQKDSEYRKRLIERIYSEL